MINNIFARVFNKSPGLASISYFVVLSTFWVLISYFSGLLLSGPIGDEGDYIGRANALIDKGLIALGDAYRPPLYPLFISFLQLAVGADNILLTARIFNIFSLTLLSSTWLYFGLKEGGGNAKIAMTTLLSIWPQFYYFSFYALAEALSFLLLGLLFLRIILIQDERLSRLRWSDVFIISIILVGLFLLKSNNILIAVPFAIYILLAVTNRLVDKLLKITTMIIMVIFMACPWFYFVYHSTGELKVTTTSGMNLLAGTGYTSLGMKFDEESLPYRFMDNRHGYKETKLGKSILSDSDLSALINFKEIAANIEPYSRERIASAIEFENLTLSIAKNIWRNNLSEQVIHGLAKVSHSFGASMRNPNDYISSILLLLSLALSKFLFNSRKYRRYVLLHWGVTLVGVIVIFFFLPNIRFKTFYFDMGLLLLISFYVESKIAKPISAS